MRQNIRVRTPGAIHGRHAVVAVMMIAAIVAAGCYRAKTAYQSSPKSLETYAMSETLVSGSFIVPPRDFKPFKITVKADMAQPRITGTFSATGANNDIEVTLFEESQFLNWQGRYKFTAAYESGRVTAGKINVELPAEAATYFVVFSNRFSIISNKGVVADVKLEYEQRM